MTFGSAPLKYKQLSNFHQQILFGISRKLETLKIETSNTYLEDYVIGTYRLKPLCGDKGRSRMAKTHFSRMRSSNPRTENE